jgi:hypothetical protein
MTTHSAPWTSGKQLLRDLHLGQSHLPSDGPFTLFSGLVRTAYVESRREQPSKARNGIGQYSEPPRRTCQHDQGV